MDVGADGVWESEDAEETRETVGRDTQVGTVVKGSEVVGRMVERVCSGAKVVRGSEDVGMTLGRGSEVVEVTLERGLEVV